MSHEIRIGVSACLLGEKVRYDGGHKHDRYITDTLGRFFSFVPVCPEVECGLPVPREAMRLEGAPVHPRLVTVESRVDLTERMLEFCRKTVGELDRAELSGFISQEQFSQLRSLPGRGLFRGEHDERPGAVRRRGGRALPPPARRGGGAAPRSGNSRELHRTGLCIPAPAEENLFTLDRAPRRPTEAGAPHDPGGGAG